MASGEPRLHQFLLNSTDVSSYVVTSSVDKEFGKAITSANIIFNKNILSVFSFDEDNSTFDVEIWRGVNSATETRVFKGESLSINKDGVNVVLNCANELNKAKRVDIVKSWEINIDIEAGNIVLIWKSIYEDYVGLSAEADVTTKTLVKWVSNHNNAFDNAADLTEILDWQQWYDDHNNKVMLQAKGAEVQGTIFTVGVNVLNNPKWSYDKGELVNKVTVIGAEQEVEETESFNGNASEDTFTLSWTPVSVLVTVGGVEQIGGNEQTSGSFDYQVDEEQKQIVFESGSIPGVGVNNVVIKYSHMLPRPVVLTDPVSIEDNKVGDGRPNDGVFESVERRLDLKHIDDATEFGRSLLSKFSTPFISSELHVNDVSDLQPGQAVTVVDAVNSVNSSLLINKVSMVYPYHKDKVLVGDRILRLNTWDENSSARIARVEDEMGKNQDILLHVFDMSVTENFEARYHKLETQDVSGLEMIWGHPTQGIWGTNEWAASLGGSSVITKLVQGGNVYKEFVYDSVFNDTGTTTATVNTGTHEIDFTNAELFQTKIVSLGPSYGFATVSLQGTDTSNLTIEISTDDGSSWQTLSSGVRTVLTDNSSVTGVLIRLTCSGTATIANTYLDGGGFNEPGIKVTLEEN